MRKAWFGVSAAYLLLAPCFAVASAAAPTASAVFGLDASFTAGAISTHLSPIAALSGSAPPAYAKAETLGPIEKIFHITAGPGPIPTLSTNVQSIHTHVASGGISIDNASAEGDATLKGLDLSLMLYPPPPGGVVYPQPFLHITAKAVQETASISQVFPSFVTATATATYSGLVISGSLIGDQPIEISGEVPNDTVIFQSPTVTITLNGKLVLSLISCFPECIITPEGLTSSAIDIQLAKANLDGRTVSGDITIGAVQIGAGVYPFAAGKSAGK
jgi:hypothetical protein